MKSLFAILFLISTKYAAHAQITDTCEYVSQNYFLGGLDCALGVFESNFQIDSYQWVNCDSLYTPFLNDTTANYESSYSGNVAVIIEGLGCTDTSDCIDVCTWGIEEVSPSKKKLVTIIDVMGRETEYKSNTPLIFIYSDGTRERAVKLDD